MSHFYELGVKLALYDVRQSFRIPSSKPRGGGLKSTRIKLPKVPKPKMPEKTKMMEMPATAPPKPMPTKSPNTGPYGLRYGGRGTEIRS